MKYVDGQPEESGYFWFRGVNSSGSGEFIVEFDATNYEVRDGDRWVDIGVFEAQWDDPEWSEPIDVPD